MNKKRVAKEWIIFLISSVFGIAIVPGVIFVLALNYGSVPEGFTAGPAYAELLLKEKGVFIFPIGTYLFVLLVRSVIWAINSSKEKDE